MSTQNGQQALVLQVTNGLSVAVFPHKTYQFTLPTKEVARGYGVNRSTIQMTKMRHDDELLEFKHFFSIVTNSDSGKPPQKETHWTKAGIIRLGFFIRSERAKIFREWAEQLILDKTAGITRPILSNEVTKASYKIIDNNYSVHFINYAGKDWFNVGDILKYFGYKSHNSTHFVKRVTEENARMFDIHGTTNHWEWYLNSDGVEQAMRTSQKHISDKKIKDVYRDLFGISNLQPVPTMKEFEDTIMTLIQVEPSELRTKLTQQFLSLRAFGGQNNE